MNGLGFNPTLSRRSFLTSVTAATVAIAGCSDVTPLPFPSTNPGYSDTDILNFALNLEYLENEFYLRAATGAGLSSTDAGAGAGTVVGGSSITAGLTPLQNAFLNEFAQSELAHLRYLRTALGLAAISRPAIDLQTSFVSLATAAGVPSPASFNPFANWDSFLVGVAMFEDIGVTAYTGSAPWLTSADLLSAAAGIQAKEAYTAALARTLLASDASAAGASQTALTAANLIINQINILAMADGSTSGGGVSISSGVNAGALQSSAAVKGGTLVPADNNSKAFGRTPNQILHIAYGKTGVGVSSGGFFPNGLNGTIKTTTA